MLLIIIYNDPYISRFVHNKTIVEIYPEWGDKIYGERCLSCHSLKDHPEIIESHPYYQFGCVVCHGGSSGAIKKEVAHLGRLPITKKRPLKIETTYGYIEANCAVCHVVKTEEGILKYDERLTPSIKAGYDLFFKKGCWGCHEITDISRGYKGPPLENIGSRLTYDEILEAIKYPEKSPPNTIMPKMEVDEREVQYLTLFLIAQKEEREDYHLKTSYLIRKRSTSIPSYNLNISGVGSGAGAQLMYEIGCSGCHKFEWGDGKVAPDLRFESYLRGPQFIREVLKYPESLFPSTIMPKFELGEEEIEAMVEYTGRLYQKPNLEPPLLWEEVCSRCHGKHGDGNGLIANYLIRPPRKLNDPEFFFKVGEKRILNSIRFGVGGSTMPPWGKMLGTGGPKRMYNYMMARFFKGKVYSYDRFLLPHEISELEEEDLKRAELNFKKRCSLCHGEDGKGNGVERYKRVIYPRDLTNYLFISSIERKRLFTSIAYSPPSSSMPAWRGILSDKEIWAIVEYISRLAEKNKRSLFTFDLWPWERFKLHQKGSKKSK